MTPKLQVLLATLGFTLGLDQATKIWAQSAFEAPPHKMVFIPDWIEFIHAENPGAAFSAFADMGQAARMSVFAVFTVIAIGALVQMFRQLEKNDRLGAASVGLILSGALGNGIDRLYKQTVTDFVKVFWGPSGSTRDWLYEHFDTNVWPIWNVADAAILIGVALFILQYTFQGDKVASEDPGANPLEKDEDTTATNAHQNASA